MVAQWGFANDAMGDAPVAETTDGDGRWRRRGVDGDTEGDRRRRRADSGTTESCMPCAARTGGWTPLTDKLIEEDDTAWAASRRFGARAFSSTGQAPRRVGGYWLSGS